MNTSLYDLLPAIHRTRDAEQGYPLKALLEVINEQVEVVEADIAQLYENWFIETAADWVVPYLADLVGYRPVPEAALTTDEFRCGHPRILVPRREVADLVRNRRGKGTHALLERLANAVGGWPALAVEFFKVLGWAQHLDHQHPNRHRLADLRNIDQLDRLNGPFGPLTHCVDVRRVQSHRTRGRYNIPSVGVFVWRLKSYPVTRTPAFCAEDSGPHCFTFSVLGNDAPLYVKPRAATDQALGEMNFPVPVRRRAFDATPGDFYGEPLSFSIWTDGWTGFPGHDVMVPLTRLIPADLSDWQYAPPPKHIAVDPVLGRLAFPPGQLPKKGVRVSYHYGFSADMGGGEYPRQLRTPLCEYALYRVGEGQPFHRIADALARWTQEKPANAVIELASSGVYVEPLNIHLGDNQRLQLRAANRVRPVLRMIDWQTDLPDGLAITLGAGSCLTLDGLIVTGRPIAIRGSRENANTHAICPSQVIIRHCTLVPGWSVDCDCNPRRPAEPGLELTDVRAKVSIDRSIVGSIQIHENEVRLDPIPLVISDSIIDACDERRQAIGASGAGIAHTILTIVRTTVFGIVDVHAMQLAENSIFTSCVNVARRQIGCMRFCYVPTGCRTPRRYSCQPDGVIAAVKERIDDPAVRASEIANEKLRVRPQFNAELYGQPQYAQLTETCAVEIVRGADDSSEMGAFHDLFQPLREANLRARLEEYTPADLNVSIFLAS